MYNVPCGDDKKWKVNAPTPVSPPINKVYCSSSHPLHSGLGLLTAFPICSNQKIRARLTLPTPDLSSCLSFVVHVRNHVPVKSLGVCGPRVGKCPTPGLGCQSLMSSNKLLRIDREGMIDDIIMNGTWCHLCKKYLLTPIITNLRWHWQNARNSYNFIWIIFELIGLLLLQWHAKVYQEMLNVNIKIAQTMQNIWNLACEQALCSHGIWNFIVWKSSLLKK